MRACSSGSARKPITASAFSGKTISITGRTPRSNARLSEVVAMRPKLIAQIVVWQCYVTPIAMNEIDTNRYDYLRRKRYVVHEEHEQFIRPEGVSEPRA